MKNNYPIRYVALPLSEKGVWKSDSEQVHGIICYLVIKCYVVGEETKYLREGYSTKEYKVVPTYRTRLPQQFDMANPEYDDEADAFVQEEAKKYMHTLLMTHGAYRDSVKLISPSGESQIVALGEDPYVRRVPRPMQKSCDDGYYQDLFFTTETYAEIVESYNLNQKRKRSLSLKLKTEDIWTNDRYKY